MRDDGEGVCQKKIYFIHNKRSFINEDRIDLSLRGIDKFVNLRRKKGDEISKPVFVAIFELTLTSYRIRSHA